MGVPPRVGSGGKSMPTPPPLRKLPPAPPLPGRSVADSSAANSVFASQAFKAPHEVLAMMIEFVPTFYVPLHSIASIMSDEARDFIRSRGKAINFFRRYRFFFDVQLADGTRYDIKLRDDVQHPRRGVADGKFSLADIGESATYSVVPEFVQNLESIDSRADMNVNVSPVMPPPALHVKLQERVPVLERLKAMIPTDQFVPIEELTERIPEDIITHPYFDVQGGLNAIAVKFPDSFQVVDGQIRIRPEELAPLALDDFSFDTSPEPEIIATIKKAVCASDIPCWISVTGLYEQLSLDQRRTVKRGYKSFASFLRTHGSSLAVSIDLLKVSHWIPPRKTKSSNKNNNNNNSNKDDENLIPSNLTNSILSSSGASSPPDGSSNTKEVVQFTQLHVLNELYDRFPRGKEITLHDFLQSHVPEHLKSSLPKNPAVWLANYPQYFVVEGITTTRDPSEVRIRRARDHSPLDIAVQLYPHIPEEGISTSALPNQLPEQLREHVKQFGIHNIVENLSEWLEVLDGDLFRKKTMDELEAAISGNKKSVANGGDQQGNNNQSYHHQQNQQQQQTGSRRVSSNDDDDIQIDATGNFEAFGDDGTKWDK